MEFRPSKSLSLGIEIELQLVRAHDQDLAHEAGDLIERLAKKKVPGAVKPEVTLSMIELNSSIQQSFAAALAELEAQRAVVAEAAGVLNLGVCGGGAHPFHDWAERRVYPDERFKAVTQRYGYLAKQFTVFGQHIHLGCSERRRGGVPGAHADALHPAFHRALGRLAVLPGRGHLVPVLAPDRGERLPALGPHAVRAGLGRVPRVLRDHARLRHRRRA